MLIVMNVYHGVVSIRCDGIEEIPNLSLWMHQKERPNVGEVPDADLPVEFADAADEAGLRAESKLCFFGLHRAVLRG